MAVKKSIKLFISMKLEGSIDVYGGDLHEFDFLILILTVKIYLGQRSSLIYN